VIRRILEAIQEKELHPSKGLTGGEWGAGPPYTVTTVGVGSADDMAEKFGSIAAAKAAAEAWLKRTVAENPGVNAYELGWLVADKDGTTFDEGGYEIQPGDDEEEDLGSPYTASWDVEGAQGDIGTFDDATEAVAAAKEWKADMIAADDEPEQADEAYTWSVYDKHGNEVESG
jgi:hypothetical protein